MTQQQATLSGAMPTSGRYGWYRDHEGVDRRRVSKLIEKVKGDTYHLELWQRRQVAEGLAQRDDLVLAVKAMGRPDPVKGWSREEKKLLDGIAKTAAEVAKTGKGDGGKIGTAIHTLTERLDRGEALEAVAGGLPAAVAQTLRAYDALRKLNGWRTIEIERTVDVPELEVRGTFDRIELVPGLAALLGRGTCQYEADGMLTDHVHHGPFYESGHSDELAVIADVKTEGQPWLNGLHIGPQLGIYSRARKMFIPTGGEHVVLDDKGDPRLDSNGNEIMAPNGRYDPMPCVRQDVAIVVHLRDGDANPYFVNLTEGWEAAVAAYEQINRESRANRKLGAAGAWFVPVPNVRRPDRLQTFTQTAAAADYANPYRPGPGQAAMGPIPPRFAPAAATAGEPPQYKIGDVVNVGGVDFVKHAELARVEPVEFVSTRGEDGNVRWVPAPDPCNNCAPLLAGASSSRVDGTDSGSCRECGAIPPAPPAEGDLAGLLIEQIWKTVTTDGLAILWNMARDRGVPWVGPVAMAGEARKRQIECPQRVLHTGDGKCACGWMPPVPA